MRERVACKAQMYRLLASGAFGNTIPTYLSVEEWREAAFHSAPGVLWAVRTQTPGGPFFPYLDGMDVPRVVRDVEGQGHKVVISAMVSFMGVVTFYGEVWDGPAGLVVSGREWPAEGYQPREVMRRPDSWKGVAAKMILGRQLNPCSLDDLAYLLDEWPGHVVEFSAMDRCLGTVPHRNGVIWEVRDY